MYCNYFEKKSVTARFKRSFAIGVGSIISPWGREIRLSLGSAQTDADRIRSDWEAVGQDLNSACDRAIRKLKNT